MEGAAEIIGAGLNSGYSAIKFGKIMTDAELELHPDNAFMRTPPT